jgi:hypothetical protein
MMLTTFPVQEIEIHVAYQPSTRNPSKNDVAMVVPATAEVSSVDGTEVTFANCDSKSKDIFVWFPEQWYKAADSNGNPVVNPVKLGTKVGIDDTVTLLVDSTRVAALLVNGRKEAQYVVFATGIREFAVGDSPPEMTFHP